MSHPILTPKVRGYRDLVVWQKSISLVVACYTVARRFPSEERWDLTRQLRRASTSVPTNIAEGAGRRTAPDYARFIATARGSLSEVETILEVARRLRMAPSDRINLAASLADEVGRMLTVMLRRRRTRA